MSREILIDNFKGLFTNADPENIPNEFASVLKNLRPYNGRLIKTFGMGTKLNSATANEIKSLITNINENILVYGHEYLGMYINSTTKVVTLYAWNKLSLQWVNFSGITGTYYFLDDYNPVILYDEIVRFLPGRISKADGTNESKGMWLGRIDRDYFDTIYSPSAAFFDYNAIAESPTLTFTLSSLADGLFVITTTFPLIISPTETIKYFYKFSYIYDGIQESLLSAPASITHEAGRLTKIAFSITKTAHNKRITAMKVYRCASVSGNYQYIHTIDFLRPSGQTLESSFGGYNGERYAYLDDCTGTFVSGEQYQLVIGGSAYDIDDSFTFGTKTVHTHSAITGTQWKVPWIVNNITAGTSFSGFTGCGGQKVVITNTGNTYAEDSKKDKYFYYAPSIFQKILNNVNIAFKLDGTALGTLTSNVAYAIMDPVYGMYAVVENGGNVDYVFFDNNIPAGAYHPLAGEVSIKINGKHAKVIGDRLWQGNICIDPGGKGEIHPAWCSYSEQGQFDVNPVSNVIYLYDEQGGEITGILENMGNPVFLKRYGIITINQKVDPANPVNWGILKSIHKIGNIAVRGAISVFQKIYVIWYDGIYQLSPNNLAPSDDTPTEKLRVSEPINDWFLGLTLTAKESIISIYNPLTNEILFCDTVNNTIYAFDVNEQTWREIDTDVTGFTMVAYDEKAEPMFYSGSTDLVYSPNVNESITCEFSSKQFMLSDIRSERVRKIEVAYNTVSPLTLILYGENGSTIVKSMTLPANSFLQTFLLYPKYSLKRLKFAITGVAGITDTKINRILIETD